MNDQANASDDDQKQTDLGTEGMNLLYNDFKNLLYLLGFLKGETETPNEL